MRKSIKEAIGTTVQDMLKSGLDSSFTQKELNALGIKIPEVVITSTQIKEIREKRHLSQTVFAKLLNVSSEPYRIDSQCKYAAVAGGDASVYLRLPTRPGYQEKIWDHAAGMIIVKEAGGKVTDINGKDLDFSKYYLHNSVMEKYSITREGFEESFSYYAHNLKVMDEIYAEAITKLSKMQSEIESK